MTSLASENLWLLLLVLGPALLIFYSVVLHRDARREYRLSWRQFAALWCLRCAAVALAIVTLARPAYRQVRAEERLPVVALLVDESHSMSFPDSRDNPLVQAQPPSRRTRYHTAEQVAQRAQEKLSRTHRVRVCGIL